MMNNEQNGLFTLITGASSGIGKALAFECASRGMHVFLVSLPGTGLPGISGEIANQFKVRAEYLETDLSEPAAHQTVLEQVKNRNISINMLVNNVGVGYNGRLEELSEVQISEMLLLNLRATTLLTQVFLPELKKSGNAHILFLGSMAAFMPLPGKSIYSASKAYILYFSRALQMELQDTGIQVSCVVPMGVPTNKNVIDRIKHSSWFGRHLIKSPEEVAFLSIDGMMKGKSIIFPGSNLKSFFWMAGIIPQGILLSAMKKEFSRASR